VHDEINDTDASGSEDEYEAARLALDVGAGLTWRILRAAMEQA
jgi:hypothetical protein